MSRTTWIHETRRPPGLSAPGGQVTGSRHHRRDPDHRHPVLHDRETRHVELRLTAHVERTERVSSPIHREADERRKVRGLSSRP